MRLWGIRAAIITALVGMNIGEGMILRPLIRSMRINLEATLIDELVMGIIMGVVICCIYEAFRRRYERKLKASVDELNHHVRNSLQVILNQQVLCPHCNPDNISDAMQRVDWALREILPKEMQPK
jgi:hypothetical protein